MKSVFQACDFACTAAPLSMTIFCKSGGKVSSHGLLTTATPTMNVSLVTVMTLTMSFILKETKTESVEIAPSMVPWSRAGTTSESGKPHDRVLGAVIGGAEHHAADGNHALWRGKIEHRLLDRGISGRRYGIG